MPDVAVAEAAPQPSGRSVVRDMNETDDRSLREWIDSLGVDSQVRITIIRKEPQRGPNGESVAGILESVEDRIDEEYVRNTWGGGHFQLKVQKPNPKGGWLHFKAFTLNKNKEAWAELKRIASKKGGAK